MTLMARHLFTIFAFHADDDVQEWRKKLQSRILRESHMAIKIVDLFAGPGGLGEGFSSLDGGKAFKILVSAEMEQSAHATLRLRSYFRLLRDKPEGLAAYYAYCNGTADQPYPTADDVNWIEAGEEAVRLTLGDKKDNATLDAILNCRLPKNEPWVLIGGPPCQAYSIAGRARNVGTPSYRAEDDHRHFLYKEYLRIIRDRRPQVFVMENVLGILSARVSGKQIFHDILRDLSCPDDELPQQERRQGYRIHSLVSDVFYEAGMDPDAIDPRNFIVKSDEYGVPQARHRVILLGVRDDIDARVRKLVPVKQVCVRDVISDLPALRSRLTKVDDTAELWAATVRTHLAELRDDAARRGLVKLEKGLGRSETKIHSRYTHGSLRYPRNINSARKPYKPDWYLDENLKVWLNHEARSHMTSDLRRYVFASSYAHVHKQSPMGHDGFALSGLAPNHSNWESGKFADRFRVQRYDFPATTITSHIAKDGHYFIHPDPVQCRSLTVREAARLQTFPDNYFFQGNKTQQYHQVGNAVPPMLANLIASIVKEILLPRPR